MQLVTASLTSSYGHVVWKGLLFATVLQEDRVIGLSRTANVAYGSGMMFQVIPGESFTMQPMKIPLDMVWIAGNRVVRVDRRLRPGTGVVHPPTGATVLLELGAGHASLVKPGAVFK